METITGNDPIEVPESIAVCPYCKGRLNSTVVGCIEGDDGLMMADDIDTDCHSEPDFDSPEWDCWLEQHCYMPYVYQLPVDMKIIDWLNSKYRFSE